MNTEFDYVTWYNFEATKEDRALVDRVYAFEEYFKDMMFAPGTPAGELIKVNAKSLDDDATILHEMIHMHEFVINEYPLFYHDTMLWSLYSDLKNKIPELDTIINEHAHILNENILYESGGLHDILFLLKSFDLDIKKGYSLGTVFAYGRADDFKNYSYTN